MTATTMTKHGLIISIIIIHPLIGTNNPSSLLAFASF